MMFIMRWLINKPLRSFGLVLVQVRVVESKPFVIDDLELPIKFVPISGPGVDALESRKEKAAQE